MGEGEGGVSRRAQIPIAEDVNVARLLCFAGLLIDFFPFFFFLPPL